MTMLVQAGSSWGGVAVKRILVVPQGKSGDFVKEKERVVCVVCVFGLYYGIAIP